LRELTRSSPEISTPNVGAGVELRGLPVYVPLCLLEKRIKVKLRHSHRVQDGRKMTTLLGAAFAGGVLFFGQTEAVLAQSVEAGGAKPAKLAPAVSPKPATTEGSAQAPGSAENSSDPAAPAESQQETTRSDSAVPAEIAASDQTAVAAEGGEAAVAADPAGTPVGDTAETDAKDTSGESSKDTAGVEKTPDSTEAETNAEAATPSKEETIASMKSVDVAITDLPPVDYSLRGDPKVKNVIWPVIGVSAINFSMWGFSKITGADFADVGPEYWKENFKTGFQWDDNEFEVNQVGHPYQGGLYFTTGRVNGLTYWQSIPYLMLGSAQWEYFAETETPSSNDWMTTVWGGMFFGEVLYRLSNRMLDDTTSGSNRFWREFAGLAINPINGLDRLFTGKMWQSGPAGIKHPLDANLKIGADGIGLSEGTGWGKTMRVKLGFEYGDPYAQATRRVPFEVFDFSFQFNAGEDILGQSFDGTGVLLGNRIRGERNQHLLAWVLDYEYFTNGTTKLFTRESEGIYQLGEMGTGFGWYGHWDVGHGLGVDARADGLFVPTGSMTSPWAKYEANRSYNYGIGGATKAELSLRHERWGQIYAKSNRYLYYVTDGAEGVDYMGYWQFGAYFNVYEGHGIGASALRYDRSSQYKYYDDVKDSFWTGNVHYELEY
jgi:hypothetical protein